MAKSRVYAKSPPPKSQERIDAAKARAERLFREELVIATLKKEKAETMGEEFSTLVAEYVERISALNVKLSAL